MLMREGSLPGPVSGSVSIAGSELIFHFPVSGQHTYLLQTTETEVPGAPVPMPGGLVLMVPALVVVVRFRAGARNGCDGAHAAATKSSGRKESIAAARGAACRG